MVVESRWQQKAASGPAIKANRTRAQLGQGPRSDGESARPQRYTLSSCLLLSMKLGVKDQEPAVPGSQFPIHLPFMSTGYSQSSGGPYSPAAKLFRAVSRRLRANKSAAFIYRFCHQPLPSIRHLGRREPGEQSPHTLACVSTASTPFLRDTASLPIHPSSGLSLLGGIGSRRCGAPQATAKVQDHRWPWCGSSSAYYCLHFCNILPSCDKLLVPESVMPPRFRSWMYDLSPQRLQ